jgi:NADPH:quinone reductase-like Zn-dependent oxidoreductase
MRKRENSRWPLRVLRKLSPWRLRQFCQNHPISGTSTDGGYAEMMIAQASGLVAIPEDLLSTEAAMERVL